MRRGAAYAWLAVLAAATAAALLLPWPVAAALALVSILILERGRVAFLTMVLVAAVVNAAILSLAARSFAAAPDGVVAAVRLAGALGPNIALLSRVPAPVIIDALRLPVRASTLLAAVLLAMRDVAEDFARLRDARLLDGTWPRRRLAAVRAAAGLVPALVLAAERRAEARREALRLAGHDAPSWFVPLVAVASLAAAGRMAFLALPNVALTFVVVFLGGMLYGARVGALGGALAMAVTDLLLSGLYPLGFVNVPAMALVGLAGAGLRRVDFVGGSRADRAAGTIFAFLSGVLGTLLFSVSADTVTWALLFRMAEGAWLPLVLAGLVFNVLPSLANGALFALSIRPVVAARRARAQGGRSPTRDPRPPAGAAPLPP